MMQAVHHSKSFKYRITVKHIIKVSFSIVRMTTPIYSIGKRHLLHLSKESLPATYSGYYYGLKHPLSKTMDDILGRFQDSGLVEVNAYAFFYILQ